MSDFNTNTPELEPEPPAPIEESTEATTEPTETFDQLSLSEAFGYLLRSPGETIRSMRELLRNAPTPAEVPTSTRSRVIVSRRARPTPKVRRVQAQPLDWQLMGRLGLLGVISLVVLIGTGIMAAPHVSEGFFSTDQPLYIGGITAVIGTIALTILLMRHVSFERLSVLEMPDPVYVVDPTLPPIVRFLSKYGLRIGLLVVAVLWTAGAWMYNGDNTFTPIGVLCWFMSVATLSAALFDWEVNWWRWLIRQGSGLRRFITRTVSFKISWTALALIVILIIGTLYRLNDLAGYPPDMTSDQVEKLLDANHVYEGTEYPVFFANNGGRESFQMYYLAVLKSITGWPFTFELIKFGSGLEGIVEILLAFWMGRALFGDEDRRLGNLTALIMAALIATSFWHTLLSRLGLRIVTTTLITTVFFIFLARALRHNRRTDWLLAGISLGVGMYMYQAVRMLPLVPIAGYLIVLVGRSRTWRDRRAYTVNFIVLVLVSLAIFVPLGRYMVENPGEFWNRTAGRLFGEAYVTDAAGDVVAVPFDQRFAAFENNLPVFFDNMKKSLLMFNWKGDSSWFNGSPEQIPALDFFTGGLFLIGLGLITVRMFRRRDPVDLLLPVSVLIMVLPGALSIAFPNEVPGFTRASGSLPMVYLIAAFALAVIIQVLLKWSRPGWTRRLAFGVIVLLLVIGASVNSYSYFATAMGDYRDSTLPYKQAGGILKGFIDSTGAPGNAYIVAYQYWWDHRAVGIEAGLLHWENTLPNADRIKDDLFNMIKSNIGTDDELVPTRQLLFFLNPVDKNGLATIQAIFPNGIITRISSYNSTRDFLTYVAPPVGCQWMQDQLGAQPASCTNAQATPTPTS